MEEEIMRALKALQNVFSNLIKCLFYFINHHLMVDKGKVDLFLPMLLNVYLLIKKKLFNKKICYKIKATKKHSHASVIISGIVRWLSAKF